MLETRREKIVILGGIPVILILFYMLVSGGGESDEATASAPPPSAAVAAVAARPAPLPAAPLPAAVTVQQPPAPAMAAGAPEPAAAVSLTGVLGTGQGGSAIISYAGGTQRLVPVGRDVLPGLTLREVRRGRVVLSGPAGPVELALGGSITAGKQAAGGAAVPPAASAEVAARTYVGAMQPQRVGGRVVGYQVRSAGDIPLLKRAGLRLGDVLLSVNGNAIDGQERLTSIPAEIAGAPYVDVEFERDGRKMRARVAAQ
jgi:type II secretory pathway component PulC